MLRDGIEIVGIIRNVKCFRETAFIICNSELVIEDISSSCLSIIGLDLKGLALSELKITSLFPDIENSMDEYRTKIGK
jgi:hypothetical protein